jgi:hypothetical protein
MDAATENIHTIYDALVREADAFVELAIHPNISNPVRHKLFTGLAGARKLLRTELTEAYEAARKEHAVKAMGSTLVLRNGQWEVE